MIIKNYVKAESLEQAYELNQKRRNKVIGGMLWVRLGRKPWQTVIDLSDVVDDEIKENEEEFVIGAMATLRSLEVHEGLAAYTQGAMKESLRHIVGVQFRNLATVGGSIYGRYGFSDVLTMFLAMDSYVDLYKGGIVPLEEYASMKKDGDIIKNIIVKKQPLSLAYLSQRNTQTDFPVLTCALSFAKEETKAVIGARPQRAVVFRASDEVLSIPKSEKERFAKALAEEISSQVVTDSNMRGSAAYRKHLAAVLTRRACLAILERGGEVC